MMDAREMPEKNHAWRILKQKSWRRRRLHFDCCYYTFVEGPKTVFPVFKKLKIILEPFSQSKLTDGKVKQKQRKNKNKNKLKTTLGANSKSMFPLAHDHSLQ